MDVILHVKMFLHCLRIRINISTSQSDIFFYMSKCHFHQWKAKKNSPCRWNVKGLQCEANWGFLALRGSEHKTPPQELFIRAPREAGWVRCTKEPRRFNVRKIKDSLTLRRTERSLENGIHHTHCLPRRSAGATSVGEMTFCETHHWLS